MLNLELLESGESGVGVFTETLFYDKIDRRIMNALERFSRELDILLADIAFSGLRNVHPGVLEKLERFRLSARELGMEQGEALLERFIRTIREYRTASADGEDISSVLCSLDFYNKNLLGNL